MSTNIQQPAPLLTLTDKARNHFLDTLRGQEHRLIRISTETSGCSGYRVVLRLIPVPEPTDTRYRVDSRILFSIARPR